MKRLRAASAAKTVDELGGAASSRVDFIRTDARAVRHVVPSNTQVKGALASPYELSTGVTGAAAAGVIRQLMVSCCGGQTGTVQSGVVLGLGAVTRRLRRGELRAVVMARDMQPPLLLAHMPVLAARQEVPLCVLACSSAQLGQPFGLLRAAAIGLDASHFEAEHVLVQLLSGCASAVPAWLKRALALEAAEAADGPRAEAEAPSAATRLELENRGSSTLAH